MEVLKKSKHLANKKIPVQKFQKQQTTRSGKMNETAESSFCFYSTENAAQNYHEILCGILPCLTFSFIN